MEKNKPVLLKELTETGFYCAINDNERYHIFEVLNNTDEEYLKETPEQTLLIDEWIYDYTDYDDRKVYGTSGNLVATCNDISTCEVYKIEDTKYKIFGNVGQFLIEDKPTYKEQLSRKTQECEEYKLQLTSLGYADAICALEIDLEHKTQECENWKETARQYVKNEEYYRNQVDQLKAENEKYKKEIMVLRKNYNEEDCTETCPNVQVYERELKQAEQKLKQIEKLCIKNSNKSSFCNGVENKDIQKLAIRILKIIDEVK